MKNGQVISIRTTNHVQQMIDKAYFKKNIGNLLKEFGYTNKAHTWYSNGLDSIVVINFQKSDYEDKYYINIGIWINSLGSTAYPKENTCHIQARLDSIFTDEIEIIEKGCRVNVEDEQYFLKLLDLFRTRVFLFLTECQNNISLKRKYQEGIFKKTLVMKNAKIYLLS